MADLPAASAASHGSDKVPFASTETKTIKIAGPVEITLTTTYNSSHVPPQAPSAADGGHLIDALRPLAELILTKLEEIKRGQEPSL